MSEQPEMDFINALDEYLIFKQREARGIDGPYFGYVYGHLETNDSWEKDRRDVAAELMEALRGLFQTAKGV